MMSPRATKAGITLDELDRSILNRLQESFPLTGSPFVEVADEIGCTEDDLIERVARLRETGVITRFGPFLDAAAMGGAFCLCALSAPADRFEEVTEIVNSFHEVAHNYEREHALNMWFVLATETADEIQQAADRIEQATGLQVLCFPKLEEYFIGFRVAA